jgi:hypothetical protein
VLNFVWPSLEPLCRARARADAFRGAAERDIDPIVKPLVRAVDAAFVAALRFYRSRRGTGQTAIDVSTFFKRRNLHKEFRSYWRGARNKSRPAFNQAWSKFAKVLAEATAA